MGILDSVERGLERAVNGAFARTFRSGVQPVEIAAGLKRELDIGSVVVDRDRVLAPNRFVVRVSSADADRLTNMGGTLERELIGVVSKHAKRQGYQLLGEPDVELVRDDSLTTGVLQIDARQVEGTVSWTPVIEVGGVQHTLRKGTTIVGRGSDADIRVTDSAASRQHLQLIWDGKAGIGRDLGSTNGTKINGERFREASLSPDTVITIGQTALRFQLVPTRQASGSRTRSAQGAPGSQASAAGGGSRSSSSSSSQAPQRRQSSRKQNQQSQQQSNEQNPSNGPAIEDDFWEGPVSELTLMIMRIGFLLLLWLFIFAIVYALRSDLFGAPVRKLPGDGGARQSDGTAASAAASATVQSAPAGAAAAGAATKANPDHFVPGPPPITPSGGALPSAGGTGPARMLVITSGNAAGTSLPLDDDVITIGRSTDSTLAIVDEYTSTHHAKLARNGDQWLLTDLDSTNGTRLDGSRVAGTVQVPTFTPVTIGTTTFELRP